MRDQEKIVRITGANRGIGAATAILAAKRGYSVCVNYVRNEKAALDVVRTIESAGGHAIPVQADIAREVDVVRLFAMCDAELAA